MKEVALYHNGVKVDFINTIRVSNEFKMDLESKENRDAYVREMCKISGYEAIGYHYDQLDKYNIHHIDVFYVLKPSVPQVLSPAT